SSGPNEFIRRSSSIEIGLYANRRIFTQVVGSIYLPVDGAVITIERAVVRVRNDIVMAGDVGGFFFDFDEPRNKDGIDFKITNLAFQIVRFQFSRLRPE